MKHFKSYLSTDFVDGFKELRFWYAGAAVFFILLTFAFQIRYATFSLEDAATLGDRMAGFAAGMKEYIAVDASTPFEMPIEWMAALLFCAYLSLHFPLRSLFGYGKQLIVAGGSRWAWWLSKCLWVFAQSFVFWGIGFLIAIAVTVLSNAPLTTDMTDIVPKIYLLEDALLQNDCNILPFFIALPFVTGTIGLIQLFISLAIHPLVAYACTAALAFLSAWETAPFLIGNFAMALRSDVLVAWGFSPLNGFAICMASAVACAVFGGVFFSRMDIIDKRNEI